MKIASLLMLLSSFILATTDVHLIAKKIDALATDNTLSSKVEYKVYDPFKRAKPLLFIVEKPSVAKRFQPLKVETILNDKAWVNGRWVKKGSIINGSKVIAIKKNAIMVRHDNKEVLIPLSTGKNLISVKE